MKPINFPQKTHVIAKDQPEYLPLPAEVKKDGTIISCWQFSFRERMKILFDLSSAKKAIVVGSEDRTEEELGYFTLFGDQASGIEPIKDLWKTQVHQIAANLKEIPEKILAKAPSPDLWKGQKAEKEIGLSYLETDIVLSAKKDLKLSENKISKKFKIPKKKIGKIFKRVKIGQIKKSIPYVLKN